MKKKKKNSNYKAHFEVEAPKKQPKNRFLLIFICIFVLIALIAGITVAIVAGVRNSKIVVEYKGVSLTREEVNFFASYYKRSFLADLNKSGISATDTEQFWNTPCYTAKNYGELLRYNTKEYIKQIVAANYIYDSTTSMTRDEKKHVKAVVQQILSYEPYYGDEKVFDATASALGFTYSDFEKVAVKLYKARMADIAVFGEDGMGIASELDFCKEFYESYSRVKIIPIYTEKDFKLDENGNRVKGEDGNDLLISLSEEEKAKRAADVENLRKAIAAFETGEGDKINTTMFETYLAKYSSGDALKDKNGFFFKEGTEYTKEFGEAFPELKTAALTMQVGSYKEIKLDLGVYFIYKYEVDPAEALYLDTTDKNGCFDDFFILAARSKFDEMINSLTPDVEFRDEYSEFDATKIPSYNMNNILF